MSELQTTKMPSIQEFQLLEKISGYGIKSQMLPSSIKNIDQAMIIALKGRELGIPPMLAFSHINVINGKPTMSAELMISMIYENCKGAIINILKNDNESCIIETKRPGGKMQTFSFTLDDAKKAGLLEKDVWKKYLSDMLYSRCASRMARKVYPDAIRGVSYTPEELSDDVDMNENGEIVLNELPKQEPVKIEEPKKKDALELLEQKLKSDEMINSIEAWWNGLEAKLTPERFMEGIGMILDAKQSEEKQVEEGK